MLNRFRLALLALVCFGLLQSPALATIWHFKIFLDGLQEVPPVVTTGEGFAVATLNDQTFQFDLAGSFNNLIGTTTSATIQGPATPVANGPVLFNVNIDLGVTSGQLSHSGIIGAGNAQIMMDGLSYINIRTTFSPTGEIRGQLQAVPIPEPATISALAVGGAAMLLRRPSRLR
jgi:hypothetical protein